MRNRLRRTADDSVINYVLVMRARYRDIHGRDLPDSVCICTNWFSNVIGACIDASAETGMQLVQVDVGYVDLQPFWFGVVGQPAVGQHDYDLLEWLRGYLIGNPYTYGGVL